MNKTDARRLLLTKTLAEAHALADSALSRVRASKRRKGEREPRTVIRAPAEPRREKVARIRGEVFARAAGCCEWGNHGPPVELHHLLSGPLRRTGEKVETTAALCTPCHRAYHAGDLGVLSLAKEWAIRGGFREALRAIDKRIDKIEAVRGVF
jgi:hypothetical protein